MAAQAQHQQKYIYMYLIGHFLYMYVPLQQLKVGGSNTAVGEGLGMRLSLLLGVLNVCCSSLTYLLLYEPGIY